MDPNNQIVLENEDVLVTSSTLVPDQFGVIARHDYSAGELLFTVKGPISDKPTKYSFSVGLHQHIDPQREGGEKDFGHYMNHSCDPNAFIRVVNDNKKPYIEVLARRNIKTGDELTFDYASLEYDTVNKSPCKCGTKLCRGIIHGFKDLPRDIAEKYKKEGILPAHLLNIKSSNN